MEGLTEWLRLQRDLEPVSVTARLRPYRLIHQLQVGDCIDRQLVDALVQEGASIVPLLTGVVRGWVQDVIREDDVVLVENGLALLGEIGEAGAIPDLLEMVTLKDPELSGPAHWALNRIVAQHPDEAARVIAEIAAELDGGARTALAEILVRHPKIDPKGALFERFFEKLDRLDKQDRDACFPALISVGIMLRGRAGIEAARSLLRRHGGLLSRNARRECDEMIEEFSSIPLPPPPSLPPSQWTVYQICNAEVDWEAELKDGEEEEEEEEDPPEPIRRKFTPGRNDPCWCGSGKKYKKCHLEADEREQRAAPQPGANGPQEPLQDFDNVRRKVGELLRTIPQKENSAAMTEFFGAEKPDEDTAVAYLVDWVIHDRISETFGRPVMEEYLERNRARLTERERNFLESSARSYVDLFEVQEVKEGSGMEVKSLTSGKTFFVHEISLSKVLARWDGLQARVIEGERGLEFSGIGSQIRRMHLESVRKWMEEDKRRTELSWPMYLKRYWPRIRTRGIEIAAEWMDSLRLTNTAGEELVLSKAVYQVMNRGALIASLRSKVEIDENEEGTSFVWLEPAAAEGTTILGNFRVAGRELTLECNSKQRLKRGKTMLAELAGPAVKFQRDEFTTQAQIKRDLKENPRPAKSAADEIPPEVERMVVGKYMEEHYAKWPDMKLPALGGKSPRQAVKNAEGKREVAELLKQFENDEERNRREGRYAYDVSRLRTELGVKE